MPRTRTRCEGNLASNDILTAFLLQSPDLVCAQICDKYLLVFRDLYGVVRVGLLLPLLVRSYALEGDDFKR